tara:strand:- start:1291 stop:2328 length:1038 start_codon:yes stop_codon:yes gene_type:complete
MIKHIVDFRSDTTTQPTDEMRAAMQAADVGDDAFGEDPTVNRLQDLAAEKMGMAAALLLPSGTMANGLAMLVHTTPGDIFFSHERGHVMGRVPFHKTGGIAPMTFGTEYGVVGRKELTAMMESVDGDSGKPSLLCIENTHNHSGGYAWLPSEVATAAAAARDCGLKIHMDGARLFNSCVAMGVEAEQYACHVDSVMFCVSKGLSAPVGSLLCGDHDFIEQARKLRSGIGGTMRQAGTVAAAGIVALETMVDRLSEDHENARLLYEGLQTIDGISPRQPPNPTNFVMVHAANLGWSSADLSQRVSDEGLKVIERRPNDLRLVLHRHLTRDDVDYAVEVFRKVVKSV